MIHFVKEIFKKKQSLLLMILFIATSVDAQIDAHLNSELNIINNAEISFTGSLVNEINGSVFNQGTIYINNNIENKNPSNRLFSSEKSGLLKFWGSVQNSIISNNDTIDFFKIDLDKISNDVWLNSHVNLLNEISFVKNDLILNGNNIILDKWVDAGSNQFEAKLTNENHLSHITGNTGYVYTRKYIKQVSSYNPGNIGIIITSSANYDYVTIERGHQRQMYPADGSVLKYFNVNPANSGAQATEIKLKYIDSSDYEGLGVEPRDFRMWYSYDNGAKYRKIGYSLPDTLNKVNTSTHEVKVENYPLNVFRLTISDEKCKIRPVKNLDQFLGDTLFLCQYTDTTLDAGNPGLNYIWNTGEYSQSIHVTESAILDTFERWVLVTDEKGCFRFDTLKIIIVPKPNANFTVNDTCLNDTNYFINLSKVAYGSLSYFWNYGDGTTTTVSNPMHLFPRPDTFTTTLIATTIYGCKDSFIDNNVYVFPRARVTFDNDAVCDDFPSIFMNNTSISPQMKGGNVTKVYWNFGDGHDTSYTGFQNDVLFNPVHEYDTAGAYVVKLVHTTSEGCKDSVYKASVVHHRPQADYTVNDVCLQNPSEFINKTTIKQGVLTYLWDFGDNTTSNVASINRIYTNPGTYSVKLIVTSEYGCQDSITYQTDVFPLPSSGFTFSNACNGFANILNDTSIISSGTLSSFWNLGDGTTNNSTNISKIYSTYGNYTVKLISISNNNCTDSLSKTVSVYPVPHAGYISDNKCLGEKIDFINSSGISQGNTTNYWKFGDGSVSHNNNPSHQYGSDGSYNVKLIVTSGNNCVDSVTKPVEVFSLPVVSLGGNVTTCGTQYILDALNAGATYLWSTNEKSRSIMVKNSGLYSVKVTDSNGCSNTDKANVILNDNVIVDLGQNQGACDFKLLDAGLPGSEYQWNTGDTVQQITVDSSGTYIVSVTDQNNCVGGDTIEILINNAPKVFLGNDTSTCINNHIILDAGNTGSLYLWNDNSTLDTNDIKSSGKWWVKVTDTATTCYAVDTIQVKFYSLPDVKLGADFSACGSTTLDAQNPGYTYLWSSNATSRIITIDSSARYWVTVTDTNGCSNADTVLITINQLPVINLGNDTSICEGNSLILDAGNSGNVYAWSNNEKTRTLTVSAAGVYWVNVSDSNFCSSQDTFELKINKNPEVSLGKDIVLCKPAGIVLDAGNQGGFYNWNSNTGISGTVQKIVADSVGKYWVTVTNSFGCTGSDTISIKLSSFPISAVFLAASKVFVKDTVVFLNLSYPDISAVYFWDFGDNTNSLETNPQHAFSQYGVFSTKLVAGNGSCTDTLIKNITVERREYSPPVFNDPELFKILHSNLYPNPNNGDFKFEIELNQTANVSVYIFSLNGSLIYQKHITGIKQFSENYNYQDLAKGVYIYKAFAGNKELTYKIIKL